MTKHVAISRGRFGGEFMSPRFRSEYDGKEPWSEDDLFDLESALAFAGGIEEIAIFLGRESREVRQKASEGGWSI